MTWIHCIPKYWKSGRHVSGPSPAAVYVLNMFVPRPPLGPSEPWFTVPFAFRPSAGDIRITVPAGTGSVRFSCGQPAKFWPKSNTYIPGSGLVTLFGFERLDDPHRRASRATSLVARFGGGAMPASIQPTRSRRVARASREVGAGLVPADGLAAGVQSEPEYQASVTYAPSAVRHDRSETMASVEPFA